MIALIGTEILSSLPRTRSVNLPLVNAAAIAALSKVPTTLYEERIVPRGLLIWHFIVQIYKLKYLNEKSTISIFKSNRTVGLILTLGALGNYINFTT